MTTVLAFLTALGLLVFLHEMGHYLAARSVGVSVERFSIGFGRVVWRRTDARGCEWALSWLPLGGYVRMNQDAPEVGFQTKPLWARAWIVVAGPLSNFLFAILAYSALFTTGQTQPAAVIAEPLPGTAAAVSGLPTASRVLAVDDAPVASLSELRYAVVQALFRGEASVRLRLAERAEPLTLSLQVPGLSVDTKPEDMSRLLGLMPYSWAVRVSRVQPESPAEQAGIQAGAAILAIDDQPIRQPEALTALVQSRAGQVLTLTLLNPAPAVFGPEDLAAVRPEQIQTLRLTPMATGAGQPARLGLVISPMTEGVLVRHDPMQALGLAAQRTMEISMLSLRAMGQMILGQMSWRQLSGPAGIADAAGDSARQGAEAYVAFLALISISIGVLNLLPVPMLDGGHLLYYGIEWLRGKPLSERLQAWGHRLGLSLIAALTLLAITSDLLRFLGL